MGGHWEEATRRGVCSRAGAWSASGFNGVKFLAISTAAGPGVSYATAVAAAIVWD